MELLRTCLQDSFPLLSSLAFQGNSPDAPSNLPKLSCGIGEDHCAWSGLPSHLVLFAAYGEKEDTAFSAFSERAKKVTPQ